MDICLFGLPKYSFFTFNSLIPFLEQGKLV